MNQIANYVYTQSEINIKIKDNAPCEYMTNMKKQLAGEGTCYGSIATQKDLETNLTENCIPVEFMDMGIFDYALLLDTRRTLIAQSQQGMGDKLGATALRKEYWYRTGFLCISQCRLANGYEIKTLHLDGKHRVVFNLTSKSKNAASVDIPEIIKYGRIPNDAKYELENYFKYILKKYRL